MSIYFFFSSRRRHTRCSRDWSSDVCSSDLIALVFSDHRLPDGSFRGLLNHVHSAGRTPPVVLTTGASDSVDPKEMAECGVLRSEEHTPELQSRLHLVCRLLLEKKTGTARATPPH